MSKVSDAIRKHHQELYKAFQEKVDHLEIAGNPDALVNFLNHELLPHAVGEEEHLYPAVESLVRAHGDATATMSIDHEFIEAYIREIDTAADDLRSADASGRSAVNERLGRLTAQLEALLKVHLEKEERVYLPLFEKYLSEDEQGAILRGMHAAYEGAPDGDPETNLDVRALPPAQRHPLIFETFEGLSSGESFVLVNDHDPRPLYYQFFFERKGQFTWDHLEAGPLVWRVRIGKPAAE
jgi:uncharacterized protein (DUF2249 family)/hemerythrin-like domain-containing protein